MLNVNDGGGLYTTRGLIQSIVSELNMVEVKGLENMAHVISCIQKLEALERTAIKMEEKKGETAVDSEDQPEC